MNQQEAKLSQHISTYLQMQFKDMIFRYDIADMNLTMNQAVRMKKLQGEKRGYPDLLICEMRGGYGGLYIELKKDKNQVFTKKGIYRQDKHNIEQRHFHIRLREKGYRVEYGFGFDDTVEKVRAYMSIK